MSKFNTGGLMKGVHYRIGQQLMFLDECGLSSIARCMKTGKNSARKEAITNAYAVSQI